MYARSFFRCALACCLAASVPCIALADNAPQAPTPTYELPVSDVSALADVFERIKRAYVKPVEDKVLLEGAMRGMVQQLDPHSDYLNEDALKHLREATDGEFGGIGIEVNLRNNRLTVISPIDNTPASQAGLKPQDTILSVNGKSTEGLSLEAAVALMKGPIGEPVTLSIISQGQNTPRTVTLKRAGIRSNSVVSRREAGDIGYLRISQFQTRTGTDLHKALLALRQQGPLSGLVLDLRNNPGGVLQGGVEVTSAFVDDGLVVYTQGRLKESDARYQVTHHADEPTLPMVVLVNEGSASAAEIVSGALQDHGRAIIMGTDTFGKGSVQSVLPLDNGAGLKLTTALYYTPNGRSIQAEGIRPDIYVAPGQVTEKAVAPARRESDLARHFTNAQRNDERASVQNTPITDYQLREAVNLLKGMSVLKKERPATAKPATSDTNEKDIPATP